MLQNIKLLLGLTDSSKDDLLMVLISQAEDFARNYIHDSCLAGLEGALANIVVYNYNRLGTEGLNSEGYSGVSYSYSSEFPDFIIAPLKARRKVKFY